MVENYYMPVNVNWAIAGLGGRFVDVITLDAVIYHLDNDITTFVDLDDDELSIHNYLEALLLSPELAHSINVYVSEKLKKYQMEPRHIEKEVYIHIIIKLLTFLTDFIGVDNIDFSKLKNTFVKSNYSYFSYVDYSTDRNIIHISKISYFSKGLLVTDKHLVQNGFKQEINTDLSNNGRLKDKLLVDIKDNILSRR